MEYHPSNSIPISATIGGGSGIGNERTAIVYVSYEGCCYEVRIRSDSEPRILDILYGLQRALCIPQYEMMLCYGQTRIDCHPFCSLKSLGIPEGVTLNLYRCI
ncbi:unnamed protein product [Didymodactylos carnosus]|uniref:Ubiquitin-like domain-containing protein n=1 Tax=Didymodactylos carnosus TaxID=1234261 RepID=A0A814R3T1_9BILA|nr:unnamed protein product [Didymodactylos carnosus]CAF3891919.1 unnamed protein product [Didymodactylos carnosus]